MPPESIHTLTTRRFHYCLRGIYDRRWIGYDLVIRRVSKLEINWQIKLKERYTGCSSCHLVLFIGIGTESANCYHTFEFHTQLI